MEREDIRDIILESMVESLEAQVRALKKLRRSPEADAPQKKSTSQLGIAMVPGSLFMYPRSLPRP
jgi:hypothetical protein